VVLGLAAKEGLLLERLEDLLPMIELGGLADLLQLLVLFSTGLVLMRESLDLKTQAGLGPGLVMARWAGLDLDTNTDLGSGLVLVNRPGLVKETHIDFGLQIIFDLVVVYCKAFISFRKELFALIEL